MMEQSDKWLSAIGERLKDAEKPVPQGVWDGIEHELDKRKRATHMLGTSTRRRWWGAAAAITGLVAAIAFWSSDLNVDSPETMAEISQTEKTTDSCPPVKTDIMAKTETEPADDNIIPTAASLLQKSHSASLPLDFASVTDETESNGNDFVATYGGEQSAIKEELTEQASLTANPPASEENNTSVAVTDAKPGQNKTLPKIDISTLKKSAPGNYTISAYGSGVIMADSHGEFRTLRPTLVSTKGGVAYAAPRLVKYNYSHKIPLNFGVVVGKEVARNIIVGAGLNYSLLISNVTPSGNIDEESFTQRVQFIGIPVNVKWRFWHKNNFSAYVGAEFQGEKCISAKFGDEKVEANRVQWSVHGIAGLQYNVSRKVGFYVEPKISHYMTDFPLTTIRTEHPINLNLQIGLNINF